MKHTFTLRRNYEFARVYQKGHHVAGRLVVLHYLRRKRADNRLGVTASRQVNGSVPRNRIKRLLRESYRLNEPFIRPGFDLILVGRASADHPKLAQVEQEMA
jgi:ribonuclease P protein component